MKVETEKSRNEEELKTEIEYWEKKYSDLNSNIELRNHKRDLYRRFKKTNHEFFYSQILKINAELKLRKNLGVIL